MYADCYVFSAMANALVGNENAAEDDFHNALKFMPNNAAVHFRYADYLLQQGRTDEAIFQLRKSLAITRGAEATLFLADALRARKHPNDVSDSFKLLSELVLTDDQNLQSSTPSLKQDQLFALRSEAFDLLITSHIDSSSIQDVEKLIASIPEGRFSSVSMLAARSKVKLVAGDSADASTLADEAISHLPDAKLQVDLRTLALYLMELERHKDALPLWQKLSGEFGYTADFKNLIRCAERVKQYGIILETCQTAKDYGFYDEAFFQEELRVLEMFDIERAVAMLQGRLEEHPSDKLAHVWGEIDLSEDRGTRNSSVFRGLASSAPCKS